MSEAVQLGLPSTALVLDAAWIPSVGFLSSPACPGVADALQGPPSLYGLQQVTWFRNLSSSSALGDTRAPLLFKVTRLLVSYKLMYDSLQAGLPFDVDLESREGVGWVAGHSIWWLRGIIELLNENHGPSPRKMHPHPCTEDTHDPRERTRESWSNSCCGGQS